ncbi:chromatin remodeling complex [Piedraia hortae CBS 480.64]|uniref:Chromatin remodeling complex n=1 Tax=Piedraia hortae CBS 480.64 TaxID=1314780 RepID=A0A6A7BUZ8_9PEZI|nr:chromatin remodeling complex [Piedraia hortae CBS 480.64]
MRRSTRGREKSLSSTPAAAREQSATGDGVAEPMWAAMTKVLNAIYDYRTPDGEDPSKLFQRKVNKRLIPEYYDTIKEPVALSTIKSKINSRAYKDFKEFVRDFALIPHNAQVFNKPASGAFQDALVIKEQLEKQLQLLVKQGVITKDVAVLPNLGKIPAFEDVPAEEADAENGEEDTDEEGEEDDEDEPDLDDEGKPKKRRGPRGSMSRRAGADGPDKGKSRARPPRLLTPNEARIMAILKGLRKPKNSRGQLMIRDFDRLPDKQAMPEYYAEIRNPMAYDLLKRKVKRKKYRTVEDFMSDVNLMFNNAKAYNTDDSQCFKHAVALQVEAGRLYDSEMAKPDDSFADDEGKIPMPNGILHNGELYKVGDWVHIQNANDLTKPIPAQVYRTFKAPGGQNVVNVCWYYRPEQTVHRFDKHFFPKEVVKTGRYRDHNIEEIEGKCFVMFYTRFFKGRPRGLPEGIEVYVCEARYNEAQHHFNKIKTWASCLPDEVRDKDYEMDLFDHPRKMKKQPSPIAYLLRDEQKETDPMPKVTWGAEGAPPKIGAVHRRPRGERDSPPPEPSPPPPPKMPSPQRQTPIAALAPYQPRASIAPSSARPVGRPPSAQPIHYGTTAAMPLQRQPSTQATPISSQHPQLQASRMPMMNQGFQSPSPALAPNLYSASRPGYVPSYRDPPQIEVYNLPDTANLSIPPNVRRQYQCDDFGRVLFFTTPPAGIGGVESVDTSTTTTTPASKKLKGHSVRYLEAKARRAETLEKKRKELAVQEEEEVRIAKKKRVKSEAQNALEREKLEVKALDVLSTQLARATATELDDSHLAALSSAQKENMERQELIRGNEKRREEARKVALVGNGFV